MPVGVLRCRRAVRPEGEPVTSPDEAQEVVEGVVLHHHHHDVLDLWDLIGACRQIGPGERTRLSDHIRLRGRRRGGGRCGRLAPTGGEHHRGAGQTSPQELPSVQIHQVPPSCGVPLLTPGRAPSVQTLRGTPRRVEPSASDPGVTAGAGTHVDAPKTWGADPGRPDPSAAAGTRGRPALPRSGCSGDPAPREYDRTPGSVQMVVQGGRGRAPRGAGGYSVVRRRKKWEAKGAAAARMTTDQIKEASTGCCMGQA